MRDDFADARISRDLVDKLFWKLAFRPTLIALIQRMNLPKTGNSRPAAYPSYINLFRGRWNREQRKGGNLCGEFSAP